MQWYTAASPRRPAPTDAYSNSAFGRSPAMIQIKMKKLYNTADRCDLPRKLAPKGRSCDACCRSPATQIPRPPAGPHPDARTGTWTNSRPAANVTRNPRVTLDIQNLSALRKISANRYLDEFWPSCEHGIRIREWRACLYVLNNCSAQYDVC